MGSERTGAATVSLHTINYTRLTRPAGRASRHFTHAHARAAVDDDSIWNLNPTGGAVSRTRCVASHWQFYSADDDDFRSRTIVQNTLRSGLLWRSDTRWCYYLTWVRICNFILDSFWCCLDYKLFSDFLLTDELVVLDDKQWKTL